MLAPSFFLSGASIAVQLIYLLVVYLPMLGGGPICDGSSYENLLVFSHTLVSQVPAAKMACRCISILQDKSSPFYLYLHHTRPKFFRTPIYL